MAQVKTPDGILDGERLENKYGGTYYSFKGIRYAEPPTGNLRFKAPVQVKPWDGIRQAKQFGPICPQFNIFSYTFEITSEDCLHLNVYTPNITPNKPLPVMFWIHGGALICGSSDIYEPEFLVRHDVILVTINYRLEVLGFLSLETEDIPGNAGMKDQVEAMRWVQRNIGSFGGDPKNVTIFGESAGAACVSFHLISPMTKGLFKRAILQSGSCLNWWCQSTLPGERARALARNLGLESDDDKKIYEFLKSQPLESLINKSVPLAYVEANKFEILFGIVDEKDFGGNERYFYGDFFEAVRAGIHEDVEIINGYTEHEGTLMLSNKENNEKYFHDANTFPEFFVPRHILMKCTLSRIIEIGSKIKKFYFQQKKISYDNILQFINFYTMYMFVFGALTWQNMCAGTKRNKIYLYKFTCKSNRKCYVNTADALGPTELFSSHSDDLAYLFPIRLYNPEIDTNSKSYKMVNDVTKLWTNFAKYGNPTPDDDLGAKWIPYTSEKKSYMDIGEHLVLKESPNAEELKFWTDIYKEFYPSIL